MKEQKIGIINKTSRIINIKGCDEMDSVWTDMGKPNDFESLKGNINTDVLIIGGGMAGLLCAHRLKNMGIDCVLVESKGICNGITKNTTAKITLQHGLIYDKLIKSFGNEKALSYLEAQRKACDEFAKLAKKIDCDYEIKDSYVYSLKNREKIEKEVNALNRLGLNAKFCEKLSLPFSVAGAVRVKNQAQFHPLKFAFEIAKDFPIYENTKVIEIMPNKVKTKNGEIKCKMMIVATHFPMMNKHGFYWIKLYQHRSYVLALENAQNVDGMYVDEQEKGMSFRNYKNLLFLGGGDHRTGKQGGGWAELVEFTRKNYPSSTIKNRWATQDCMSLDGIPYIGQYSKNTPNLYVATGFNKWGMTSSMISALILSDLVQGKHTPYKELFSPSRSIFKPQLALNTLESILGLLKPTKPRCPHMGCALKYNPQEHSWDCPCHGSRFEENGELIDNPATDDKKFK